MPKPAEGSWPANVSAVIVTPEEKESLGAPSAKISVKHVKKSPPSPQVGIEEQIQDAILDRVIGRAAIITSRKFGLNYVWRVDNSEKIAIAEAEQLIKKNPGFVYFDFDAFTEETPDETETNDEVIDAIPPIPNDSELDEDDELDEPAIEADDDALEIDADKLTDEPLEPNAFAELPPLPLPPVETEKAQGPIAGPIAEAQAAPNRHIVTEREKRAWGGVLTSPGQQVYVHPSGVIRVEVDGPILLQKGRAGETRVLRISRLKPTTNLSSVNQQPVTPATTAQQPASVTYRKVQSQSGKVPIPRPKQIEDFEDSDF